ncbi:MAG: hypothetical protein JXR68_06395 [Bacteroidales bacterium]|nr:hypothetical protein [Bacteroidales bacterium]
MKYFFTHIKETERVQSKDKPLTFHELLSAEIVNDLRNSYMKNILVEEKKIKFVGNIFRFVWNGFNVFNPIYKGEISFKIIGRGTYISYKIFFWEFFVIALLFSLIPALGIFPNFAFRMVALFIIWGFYLGSTLLSVHRFENYLKNVVMKKGGEI